MSDHDTRNKRAQRREQAKKHRPFIERVMDAAHNVEWCRKQQKMGNAVEVWRNAHGDRN